LFEVSHEFGLPKGWEGQQFQRCAILLLFEDPAAGAMAPVFGRKYELYYNPLISKVQITVEGIPNQLYAQGVLPRQDWDEIVKDFAREDFKNAELPSTDMSAYFKSRCALWLDFRSCDRKLQGSGCRVENTSEVVTLQLHKTARAAGSSTVISTFSGMRN